MKIKKYEARTEQEAIEKVKSELGLDALILNIKKTQPRGLFSFFRKPYVEVTAAFDEKSVPQAVSTPKAFQPRSIVKQNKATTKNEDENVSAAFIMPDDDKASESVYKDRALVEQQEKIFSLEEKLNSAEDLLEKVLSQLSIAKQSSYIGVRKYENSMIQILYDSLVDQGVSEKIAEKLLEDANSIQEEEEKNNVTLIIKIVYNTIMNVFGEPEPVDISNIENDSPKTIVFMGPTGVGKTTTIAKLSSLFILNHSLKVGLITADTYRIAAVEQLKTYAEILGINLGIVYNEDDLMMNINLMKNTDDIVIIDTAGRSHKNGENLDELSKMLSIVPDSEKFLVLSTTTKYEDLLNIISVYKNIAEFKLIFTKLDETTCLGIILNICYITGKKLSYVTYGQNVPEDIEIVQPEKLTKSLLGLGGGLF